MIIRIKGMINKYKGNEKFGKGKRKMLLIRQKEWNKQKGNDKKNGKGKRKQCLKLTNTMKKFTISI